MTARGIERQNERKGSGLVRVKPLPKSKHNHLHQTRALVTDAGALLAGTRHICTKNWDNEDDEPEQRIPGDKVLDFIPNEEADKQVSCAMSPPLSWWPEDAWNDLRAHALGLYVGGMDLSQVAEIVWVNVDGVKELLKMRAKEIKGGTGAMHQHLREHREAGRVFLEAREEMLEVAV